MDFSNDIKKRLDVAKLAIDAVPLEQIRQLVSVLLDAHAERKMVFTFGNGGSASTASHLVNDLSKGACLGVQKKIRAVCLNDSVPTMMAFANDNGYECIFREQLAALINPGDVVIAISGSGNSPNIIQAIDYANAAGAHTVGFCGYDGGVLKSKVKYPVHVPLDDMETVEGIHSVISHVVIQVLRETLKAQQ